MVADDRDVESPNPVAVDPEKLTPEDAQRPATLLVPGSLTRWVSAFDDGVQWYTVVIGRPEAGTKIVVVKQGSNATRRKYAWRPGRCGRIRLPMPGIGPQGVRCVSSTLLSCNAPIAQLAEAADLKSAQCPFESDWGHHDRAGKNALAQRWRADRAWSVSST